MIQFLLPILGGLGALGGSAMQASAAETRQKAINDQMRAERERDALREQRMNTLSQETVDRAKAAPESVGLEESRLAELFRRSAMQAQDEEAYSQGSQAGSLDAQLRQQSVANNLQTRGDAMATLGSMGAAFGNMGLAGQRRDGDIEMINGARRRSQNILNQELDAANQQGNHKAAMGRLVSALGQTAMSAGMAGFGGGGMGGADALSSALTNAGAPVNQAVAQGLQAQNRLGMSNGGAFLSNLFQRGGFGGIKY